MSRTDHHRPWQIRAADRAWAKADDPAYYDTLNGEWTLPHAALSSAPHWYVHHVWYGPERQRERVCLAAMAQEYNTRGECQDDFPCPQHRHMAEWLWS